MFSGRRGGPVYGCHAGPQELPLPGNWLSTANIRKHQYACRFCTPPATVGLIVIRPHGKNPGSDTSWYWEKKNVLSSLGTGCATRNCNTSTTKSAWNFSSVVGVPNSVTQNHRPAIPAMSPKCLISSIDPCPRP